MSRAKPKYTAKHLTVLRWAVSQAAEWKGYYAGHEPDYTEFLQRVEKAREALRAIPRPHKQQARPWKYVASRDVLKRHGE